MNVVLVGPPGAGKGTQAGRLKADFRVPHISVESSTRGEAAGTSTDEQEALRVAEELGTPACARGFVLEGFPRTVAQAETLERALEARGRKLHAVVALEVPEEMLFERLSGRRVCPLESSRWCGPPIAPGAAGRRLPAGSPCHGWRRGERLSPRLGSVARELE